MNALDRHDQPTDTLGIMSWALAILWAVVVMIAATGPDATDGRLDWVAAGAHVSASLLLTFLLANALWPRLPLKSACLVALVVTLLFANAVEAYRFTVLGFPSASASLALDVVGALAGAFLSRRLTPRVLNLANTLRN